MNGISVAPRFDDNRIIPFELIIGGQKEKEVKYNKDGSVRKTKCNKVAGQDSEVYAFKTKEEINAMIDVLNNHIDNAINDNQKQIAHRNKMLFLIGINIGIRGSDLRTLKWSFFFDKNDDETLKFKTFYVIQPMKQRKQKKFVKLFFNDAVKNAVNSYIEKYPIDNLDDYLFSSRKGDEPIEVSSLWRIIKNTAVEAGIEQNIGSHSLRKTFGFWCWHNSDDKNKALVILQQIFNHSSTQVTAKYIGILDDEIEDMFHSINLGLDE
ncbi:MAG: tyrosine-type recombinase/integrase [Bacteroidales bacterium]|nr:tyrosine-type recombinase/integrase [Bacteroidales bacterium]